MTVTMWMNILDNNPTGNHGILSTEGKVGASYVESFGIYTYRAGADRRFGVQVLHRSPNKWYLIYNNAIPTGWTHVAGVFDPSLTASNRLKVYLDGSSAGLVYTLSTSYVDNPHDEMVAGRLFSTEDHSYGEAKIDEVLIFESPLSQAEVQQIYNEYP